MKRILFISGLLLLATTAGLARPVSLESRYVHENASNGEMRFLMGKIMRGQPVNVLVQAPHNYDQIPAYKQYVQELYDIWFRSLADILRQSKRPEFNDLLSRLPQRVNLRFVSVDETYDIEFLFVGEPEIKNNCQGDKHTLACTDIAKKPLKAWMPEKINAKKNKVLKTHLHEVGHTLGLGDDYYKGRNQNADPNYQTDVCEKSVMNSGSKSEYVSAITPCDADGMVLAIDLAMRNYNRGGETGWRSLNKKSERYYIHGKTANSPHSFHLIAPLNVSFLQYDNNGTAKVNTLSFGPAELDPLEEPRVVRVIKTDAQGRPVVERGALGEDIYTSYFYESVRKLFVKQGKVIRYEETLFAFDAKQKDIQQQNQKKVAAKDVFNATHEGLVIVQGDFDDYSKEKYVRYQKADWSSQHRLFYSVTCTKKGCEEKKFNKPTDQHIVAHANGKAGASASGQNALFKKLKAWLAGKGTIGGKK